ncbi:MAG: hypothetical protein ACOCRX_07150 [Candidatus Woesearchaeota archaeon]
MNLIHKIKKENLVIPLMGAPGIKLSESSIRDNLKNANIQFKSLARSLGQKYFRRKYFLKLQTIVLTISYFHYLTSNFGRTYPI